MHVLALMNIHLLADVEMTNSSGVEFRTICPALSVVVRSGKQPPCGWRERQENWWVHRMTSGAAEPRGQVSLRQPGWLFATGEHRPSTVALVATKDS